MKTTVVIEICPICGTEYILGKTGVTSGCDACLEISRDLKGYPWHPNEMSHIHLDFKDHTHVITREQAFGNVHFYDWEAE